MINLNKLNDSLLSTFLDSVYEDCLQLYHNKYLDINIIYKEIEDIYLDFFKSERILSNSETIEIINKKDIFIKECEYILNLPTKTENKNILNNNLYLFKKEIKELKKLQYLSKNKNFNDIHNQISLNIDIFKKKTAQVYAKTNKEIYIEYSKLTFQMINQVWFMLKIMNIEKYDNIDKEIESVVNSLYVKSKRNNKKSWFSCFSI